jgi:hypothetical protein
MMPCDFVHCYTLFVFSYDGKNLKEGGCYKDFDRSEYDIKMNCKKVGGCTLGSCG